MTHIFHSRLQLFLAEMRVLAWMDYILLALALGMGVYAGLRFIRRRRSVVVAGIHLATATLVWLAFLGTWYFWQIDWELWQGRVAYSQFLTFLAGGGLLVAATIAGLVLHHRKPDRRKTPGQLVFHLGTAVLGALAVAAGMRVFL
ncbi:MAG: hypothetical protein K6U87_03610 [Firmicutes bacterium]|nr:hypothetical protein [Bacillota bacterium]